LTELKQFMPQSIPPAGPLSGEVLPNAGAGILKMMLGGMQAEQFAFQDGFAMVLEEATIFAVNAFQTKALEEMQKNRITMDLLGDIASNYGGLLTADDKEILKSSMDVSGMYGVITAIVADGASTRKVLTEIQTNTAGLRGWQPTTTGAWGRVTDAALPAKA
jgi:hypothetical protein